MRELEVSVVMSVYNGEEHLAEGMDSILSQEGVSLEFIIVDDGSTDRSAAMLKEYASRDGRVRIISQENQGLTKALITGCAAARGKYIARQDAGDISLPDRLRLQKAAFDADEQLVFVSCWTEFCGPKLEHLYVVRDAGLAGNPVNVLAPESEQGLSDGPTCHPSVMFRARSYFAAGGYRAEFYYGQDHDLWYRLAERGKFQTVRRTLYQARVTPISVSSANKSDQEAFARLSRGALALRLSGKSDRTVLDRAKTIGRPTKRNRESWLKKDTARIESGGFYFIGECLRRNGDHRANAYFLKSIWRKPLAVKPWVRLLFGGISSQVRRSNDSSGVQPFCDSADTVRSALDCSGTGRPGGECIEDAN